MQPPDTVTEPSTPALQAEQPLRLTALAGYALLVGAVVLLASLFGVWTRLAGQLAVFWPANALLLGLLVRFPRLDNTAGWIGAVLGYLAGGYLAGDPLRASVLLTLGNFASVVTGYLLLARLGPQHRRLAAPTSVLHLVWVASAAALAAGLAGAAIGPTLFAADPLPSGLGWAVSEIVNYIAILPAMLSLPQRQGLPTGRPRWPGLRQSAPFVGLLVSLALALWIGGPGAVVFPVPALLWCAMRYGVFVTSLLTLACTAWTLAAMTHGILDMFMRIDTPATLMSIRLGVALVALSPIAVAGITAANRTLLARMLHMANHDPLTGTMNRRAFAECARTQIDALRAAARPAALLLADIDRFKAVNDVHGHGAGDLVLVQVAQRLVQRRGATAPVVGRVGGEEFAVLLPDADAREARRVAEALRQASATEAVVLEDGRSLTVTLSIGVCVQPLAQESLERMFKSADRALYAAKNAGRDRVVLASDL